MNKNLLPTFGNWRLTSNLCLVNDQIPYEIDLETVQDSASLLDWIIQLDGRCGKADLADLVRAFSIVFNPQSNFCPSGQNKVKPDLARSYLKKIRPSRLPIKPSTRFRLLVAAGFRCQACGASSSVTTLHVDHILPLCAGGNNESSNLQVLCVNCNLGKGGMVYESCL
jgi:hypothetical protein